MILALAAVFSKLNGLTYFLAPLLPAPLPLGVRLQKSQNPAGHVWLEWETWKVNRAYYSQRIGRGPLANPSIEDVARVLTLTVDEMWRRGYMQEWHGFTCVDAGEIDGRAGGVSLADHIEAETGWRSAWPLSDPLFSGLEVVEGTSIPDSQWEEMEQSCEDMVFDLIEYFHGHVSEGIEDHERSVSIRKSCERVRVCPGRRSPTSR